MKLVPLVIVSVLVSATVVESVQVETPDALVVLHAPRVLEVPDEVKPTLCPLTGWPSQSFAVIVTVDDTSLPRAAAAVAEIVERATPLIVPQTVCAVKVTEPAGAGESEGVERVTLFNPVVDALIKHTYWPLESVVPEHAPPPDAVRVAPVVVMATEVPDG